MPRKKKKSGKTNTLICSVPGLWNPIEVPFEARKLPVCKKCKKIFKTRQLCRVRDGHNTLPWNTTYLCFLLDDSCIVDGKFSQSQDDKFVAEMIPEDVTPPLPYIADLNKLGPDPPICRQCKEKNYTRYHCRTSHCHNQLPWNTSYAVLKRVENSDGCCNDSTDGSTSVPNLDSPSTTGSHTCSNNNMCTKSSSDYNYDGVSSKRSLASGNHEDQFQMKKMRTDNHVFGYENITQISECKAFVLMMHEDNISLHVSIYSYFYDNYLVFALTILLFDRQWLRTSSCSSTNSNTSEVQQSASMNSQTQVTTGCDYQYHLQNANSGNGSMPIKGDPESREPSPFHVSYGDLNSLEPMPYNPMSSQGYGPNDYHLPYHYTSNSYSRPDSHGASAQYQYQQSYSQMNPSFGYRQPPSPPRRYSGPDSSHCSMEGANSYNPHYYSHNRFAQSDDYEETSTGNDRTVHPNFYRHEPQSWSNESTLGKRDYQHEQVRWDNEKTIPQAENSLETDFSDSRRDFEDKVDSIGHKCDQPEPIRWE
jgi:hypothetical protein